MKPLVFSLCFLLRHFEHFERYWGLGRRLRDVRGRLVGRSDCFCIVDDCDVRGVDKTLDEYNIPLDFD